MLLRCSCWEKQPIPGQTDATDWTVYGGKYRARDALLLCCTGCHFTRRLPIAADEGINCLFICVLVLVRVENDLTDNWRGRWVRYIESRECKGDWREALVLVVFRGGVRDEAINNKNK